MPGIADNPIESASEDLLRRGGVARALAANVRSVDASKGYVLAVLGPWGSGKTSLINLARELLGQDPAIPVLDFNPWMFSGAEQLVEAFFTELAAQLRLKGGRFAAIAGGVDAYAKLLSPLGILPFVGAFVGRANDATGAIRDFAESRKDSVKTRRETLEVELRQLDRPIVVVVDDIDRLTTAEIREIFKLVRLTASFPNIIYLLSFDRARVEQALAEDGIPGRDYLEKIVQTAIDIPRLPEQLLMSTFLSALNRTVDDTGAKIRLDQNRIQDVLAEIIWPLVKTMRDVRRYTASIYTTITELRDDIELADVLALEAIRVFRPNTFHALQIAQSGLTQNSGGLPYRAAARDPLLKTQIDHVVNTAADEDANEVAKALINRVFPAAQQHLGGSHYDSGFESSWLRGRLVAHREILRLYFERVAGEALEPFMVAEGLFAVMTDETAFSEGLALVEPADLEDVISALANFEREFDLAHALPAVVALLNCTALIPERAARGVFDICDPRLVVGRIVYLLLNRLNDSHRVSEVVDAALPKITHLSDQMELIRIVGYEDGAGHHLVTEDLAEDYWKALSERANNANPAQLANEKNLLRLFHVITRTTGAAPTVELTPAITRTLMMSARTESRSGPIGSRTVIREAHLAWESLIAATGDENQLRAAIDGSRSLGDDDSEYAAVLELADRYLSGWRPRDFGD